MKNICYGFTLAEVLITLAIIGVVAALTIPSVISNSQQLEFKTGLKKAVSVLNSSLAINTALENETPYDNSNLFGYLQQHMSVIKSTTQVEFNKDKNLAFYTTDGMRYEFPTASSSFIMHEDNITLTFNNTWDGNYFGKCGSYGLNINPDNTTKAPCLIMVDVNGDRKPNPANANNSDNEYTYSRPTEKLLKDVFAIMITDRRAVPLGVSAQRAMYDAQKGQSQSNDVGSESVGCYNQYINEYGLLCSYDPITKKAVCGYTGGCN